MGGPIGSVQGRHWMDCWAQYHKFDFSVAVSTQCTSLQRCVDLLYFMSQSTWNSRMEYKAVTLWERERERCAAQRNWTIPQQMACAMLHLVSLGNKPLQRLPKLPLAWENAISISMAIIHGKQSHRDLPWLQGESNSEPGRLNSQVSHASSRTDY